MIEDLKARAIAGDVEAWSRLGLMYETGRDVAQDDVLACHWHHKAVEQGYADAQGKGEGAIG